MDGSDSITSDTSKSLTPATTKEFSRGEYIVDFINFSKAYKNKKLVENAIYNLNSLTVRYEHRRCSFLNVSESQYNVIHF